MLRFEYGEVSSLEAGSLGILSLFRNEVLRFSVVKFPSSWLNFVAFSYAPSLSFCQRPVEKELLYPFTRWWNRGSAGESHQVTPFKSSG